MFKNKCYQLNEVHVGDIGQEGVNNGVLKETMKSNRDWNIENLPKWQLKKHRSLN